MALGRLFGLPRRANQNRERSKIIFLKNIWDRNGTDLALYYCPYREDTIPMAPWTQILMF